MGDLDWDRPENIWTMRDTLEMYQWWNDFYKEVHTHMPSVLRSVDRVKQILGEHDRVVVLRHRCWVWERPRQRWCLYVDKRGPAFHVKRGCTPEQAREAFSKFKKIVEKKLSQCDK